jgi:hypothetical protein
MSLTSLSKFSRRITYVEWIKPTAFTLVYVTTKNFSLTQALRYKSKTMSMNYPQALIFLRYLYILSYFYLGRWYVFLFNNEYEFRARLGPVDLRRQFPSKLLYSFWPRQLKSGLFGSRRDIWDNTLEHTGLYHTFSINNAGCIHCIHHIWVLHIPSF